MKNIKKNIIDNILKKIGIIKYKKYEQIKKENEYYKIRKNELNDKNKETEKNENEIQIKSKLLINNIKEKKIQEPLNTGSTLFSKKIKISQVDKIYRLSFKVNETFILTTNLKKSELQQLYIDIEEILK